jgi:AcrR family transcriptional regulator
MKKQREPIQKRSIEKKEKIIKAGLELFSKKGYHHTNTAEIAKCAGVSTGIVYSYFADKKDIFMAALVLYSNKIFMPIKTFLNNIKNLNDIKIEGVINKVIELSINLHFMSKNSHEEMIAMSHLDDKINEYFFEFKDKLVCELMITVKNLGLNPPNLYEKMHIIVNIVEELSHDLTYHSYILLKKNIIIEETIKIIKVMLLEKTDK